MKISIGFLLLLLGSALPSPVPETKEVKEDLMYPYGEAVGDTKNPKDDDGTSQEIKLLKVFSFFGKPYKTAWVNNNGVISFAKPVPEYTPKAIPLKDGRHFVAPYWGDVNNILGGNIWWRQEQDPEILKRCTKNINEYFPEFPFTATWTLIATWDCVPFFGSVTKKCNTFQAILITNGKLAFIMMNYKDIQWTTGAASGGDRRTGLGGVPAQSGFDSGDDKNYFSIPGSRTPQIINITKTSNVEFPGRWVFRVDHFEVTGIPEELLHPPKEEEKASSHEEQGQQSNEGEQTQVVQGNEDNSQVQGQEQSEESESVPSGGMHQEEEPPVGQGNEDNSEVQGQEQMEGSESVPSEEVHQEEEPSVVQGNENNSEVQGQEQTEESESVPSEEVHQEEEPPVAQGNEDNSEIQGQEQTEESESVPSEEVHQEEEPPVVQGNDDNSEVQGQEQTEESESVPSGDVHEEEEPQVVPDNEDNSEVEEKEQMEELEPVPSGDVHEEEPQVSQDNEDNSEAEGQQKEEENGGTSAVDTPDLPVQNPEIYDDSEEYDDCE